jgi:hypothetical protein
MSEETIESLKLKIDLLQQEKRSLENDNEYLSFKREVAEWAVYGVINKNLKISLDPDVLYQTGYNISYEMGKISGKQFLHESELAFKQHAEMNELIFCIKDIEMRSGYKSLYLEKHPSAIPRKWFFPKRETLKTDGG